MTLEAQLTRTWAINPNVRKTPFVSLNDTAGWWFFQNFSWLIANGWTVQYTCDGTTGPTSGSDHTNRLTTQSTCQTQGAAAGNAQSFAVVNGGDGQQLMIAYQGATADVLRISYSPGGLYTPAATSNQQPTATDEVVISTGTSIVNATTNSDRVMSVWTTTDAKQWMCAVFRQSATVIVLGLWKINNVTPTGVFVPPYMCFKVNVYDRNAFPAGSGPASPNYDPSSNAIGAATWWGVGCRASTLQATKLIRCIAGGWQIPSSPNGSRQNSDTWSAGVNTPALQGGGVVPVMLPVFTGEAAVGFDGVAGYAIDWWFAFTSSASTTPALGDFLPGYDPGDNPNTDLSRTNWLVAFGPTMVMPWRNVAASIQIT